MKPVVHYIEVFTEPILGESVLCLPVDHPDRTRVSNMLPIVTTPVVRLGREGEFETRNTIYRRLPTLQ